MKTTVVVARQRGIALLVALVVLIVVTLLGTAAMRSALFQTRISTNAQASQLLFQGAESGLEGIYSYAVTPPYTAPDKTFGDVGKSLPGSVVVRFCLQPNGTTVQTPVAAVDWTLTPSPGDIVDNFTEWCDGIAGSPPGSELVQVAAIMTAPPESSVFINDLPPEVFSGCVGTEGCGVAVYTQSFARIPGVADTTSHVQIWLLPAPPESD